jgi:hypothetical protein
LRSGLDGAARNAISRLARCGVVDDDREDDRDDFRAAGLGRRVTRSPCGCEESGRRVRACGGRPAVYDQERSVIGPIPLGDRVAYVDSTRDRVVVLDAASRPPRAHTFAVGHAPRYAAPIADAAGMRLAVITRGREALYQGERDEAPGLYLLVEDIDREFVRDRFPDDSGNLYKEAWPLATDPAAYVPALQTNEATPDTHRLAAFAQALRLRPAVSDIPIVVISADGNPQRAAAVHAIGYLAKPFDIEALLAQVAGITRAGSQAPPAVP